GVEVEAGLTGQKQHVAAADGRQVGQLVVAVPAWVDRLELVARGEHVDLEQRVRVAGNARLQDAGGGRVRGREVLAANRVGRLVLLEPGGRDEVDGLGDVGGAQPQRLQLPVEVAVDLLGLR